MARLRNIDCSGPGITRKAAGAASSTSTPRPEGHRRRDPPAGSRISRSRRPGPTCGSARGRRADPGPGAGLRGALLDHGFFRIGTEQYAEENDSFGIATMRREHVSIDGGIVVFDYPGRAGSGACSRSWPPRSARWSPGSGAAAAATTCFVYRDGRAWVDVTSRDINDFVKSVCGPEHSAKDFRTWNATVLAALAVAVSGQASAASGRDRAVVRAVKEYLGNTPAVARSGYIDPLVFDRYRSGWTIAGVLADLGVRVEEAVLDLLEARTSAKESKRSPRD